MSADVIGDLIRAGGELQRQAAAAEAKREQWRAMLEPLRGEAELFYRILYSGAEPGSELFIGPKHGLAPAPRHFKLQGESTDWRALADLSIEAALYGDLYVTVCPNLSGRVWGGRHGRVEEKASCGGIWADIDCGGPEKSRPSEGPHAPFFKDIAEAVAFAKSLPVPPTLIVCSGGGIHCYWVLTQHSKDLGLVHSLASALQTDLRARARALPDPRYGCDYTPSPVQLLRPPASLNFKQAEPRVARLLEFNDRRYSIEELTAHFKAAPAPVTARRSAPARAEEMTERETMAAMRASVLRAMKWPHRLAALRFLEGKSWASRDQELTLTRIAWHLCRACQWRPSEETLWTLCEQAEGAVDNTRSDEWRAEDIFARFESAISRGLAAAETEGRTNAAIGNAFAKLAK